MSVANAGRFLFYIFLGRLSKLRHSLLSKGQKDERSKGR
jgi:hypothetical protein